jgi:L-serine dehydratase
VGVFDIIGPVMIGPSSSHTAGACRIGNLARAILGAEPTKAVIGLHGSFADTGKGHGTDLALVGGILGFAPDDPRIRHSLEWAGAAGLQYSIAEVDLGPEAHPNSATITLTDATGRENAITASSVGGGEVEVVSLDGVDVSFSGELPSMVVAYDDRPGMIAAVSRAVADAGVNIGQMTVRRRDRGDDALMVLEMDQMLSPEVVVAISGIPGVHFARAIGGDSAV